MKATPQELTAVSIITNNCTQQLTALAQGLVRSDLVDDRPRLQSTARNACVLARDALSDLLTRMKDGQWKGSKR